MYFFQLFLNRFFKKFPLRAPPLTLLVKLMIFLCLTTLSISKPCPLILILTQPLTLKQMTEIVGCHVFLTQTLLAVPKLEIEIVFFPSRLDFIFSFSRTSILLEMARNWKPIRDLESSRSVLVPDFLLFFFAIECY